MRVMTWNIHGGVGPDGRCDLHRIVDLARRHAPDILALQEVDERRMAGSAFEFLADSLGGHCAQARLITAPDGDYGHIVISRWPLTSSTQHDLSVAGRERRGAIDTTVDTPNGPLRVMAVHLGLGLRERRRQARALAAISAQGPERAVLLGDFNEWTRRGAVQRTLTEQLPRHTHHKSWPAFRPLFALDRIYCRPSGLLAHSWTDACARAASDHLPIIADLKA
ncbi:endonuclease/exonuclease/phosphatase family protein [soil metagenome]